MKCLLMLLLSTAAFAQTNTNSVDTNQPVVWVTPHTNKPPTNVYATTLVSSKVVWVTPHTNKPPEENREATNVPVGSIPGVGSNTVTAALFWVVGQGEWQETGVMVDSPKGPAHLQKAVVASNLVASIVWKGRTNLTVIDSIPIREAGRIYYIESVKHFSQ